MKNGMGLKSENLNDFFKNFGDGEDSLTFSFAWMVTLSSKTVMLISPLRS